MAGFCAIVDLRGEPFPEGMLDRMIDAAPHRGAERWRFIGQGVALASLSYQSNGSAAGPGAAPEAPVVVGDIEVHNRSELIWALTRANAVVSDQSSDDELIGAAFERWGTEASHRILGDFAFAVWLPGTRTLHAVRDTAGGRPLYYRYDGRRLFIGSEVKQILAVWSGPYSLNEAMLGAYLVVAGGRPEWTFFEGIDQLPRAHALEAGSTGVSIKRYWDVDPGFLLEYPSTDEYADHLRELIVQAVACREAPRSQVGVWLSGGLDSGAVASALGAIREGTGNGSVTAFSYAFDELREADERAVSRHIVDRYGFAAVDVPADDAWPLRDASRHGPDRDEPLMGAYQPLHDRVLDAARSAGVETMFMGISGDNIAGGDVFDYPAALRRNPRATWHDLRAHAEVSGQPLLRLALRRLGWPIVAPATPTRLERWLRHRINRGQETVPTWIRPAFAARVGLVEIAGWRPEHPNLQGRARRARYAVVNDVITTRGVIWNERNHAKHGLGFSDPWSDRRLAEFAVAVPQWLFNRGDERKALVRGAMRGVMPEPARIAAGKTYPTPLYSRGIDEQEREVVADLLTDSRLAGMGIIDARQLLAQVQTGESHGSEWPVLSTELWLRRFWT